MCARVYFLQIAVMRYCCMSRPDLFDYLGMALLAMIVALWVAHFVLPAPPHLPSQTGPQLPSMLQPGR